MKISWKSPSNLAIVKYWGKYGQQLPRNASISFTLDHAYTETHLSYKEKEDDGKISLDFKFEGAENKAFADKIERFLGSLLEEFPFLTSYHLSIESSNCVLCIEYECISIVSMLHGTRIDNRVTQ